MTVYKVKKKGEFLYARKHGFLEHSVVWEEEQHSLEFPTMTEAILFAEMNGATGYEVISIARDEPEPPSLPPRHELGENGAG